MKFKVPEVSIFYPSSGFPRKINKPRLRGGNLNQINPKLINNRNFSTKSK